MINMITNKQFFNKFIFIFIVIQPLIDILTGIMVTNNIGLITVGVILRTLFMLYLIFNFVVLYLPMKDRNIIYIILGLILYFILSLLNLINVYGFNSIFLQLNGYVKTFYFPISLLMLFLINKKIKININNNSFIYALLFYTLTIFICGVLDVGYDSYSNNYKDGTNGLFYAANETGALVSILAPYLFYLLFSNNKIWQYIVYVITLIAYLYTCLEMGTKVPVFALIIIGIILFVVLIINVFNFKLKKINYCILYKVILALITLILFVSVIDYTPAGVNLKTSFTHTNINQEEDTDDSDDEIKDDLLSGRGDLLVDSFTKFSSSSIATKVFGIGYVDLGDFGPYNAKMVEMDYFDIFLNHGFIGSLIYFSPIVIILFSMMIMVIKKLKSCVTMIELYFVAASGALGFGIAFVSGHVFVAPAVSTILMLSLVKLYNLIEEV